MEEFTKKLKTVRKSKKLTQKQVAHMINLHRTTYTKYENKKRYTEPPLDTLRDLCLLFNVSADYLIGLPKGMPYPKEADSKTQG